VQLLRFCVQAMATPSAAQALQTQITSCQPQVGSVEGLQLQLEKSRHETEDLHLQLEVSRREMGMVHELQMQLALSRRDAAKAQNLQQQLEDARLESQRLKEEVGGQQRNGETTSGEVQTLRARLGAAEEAASGARVESEKLRGEVETLRLHSERRQERSADSSVSFASPETVFRCPTGHIVTEDSPPRALRSSHSKPGPSDSRQDPRSVEETSASESPSANTVNMLNSQRRITDITARELPPVFRNCSSGYSDMGTEDPTPRQQAEFQRERSRESSLSFSSPEPACSRPIARIVAEDSPSQVLRCSHPKSQPSDGRQDSTSAEEVSGSEIHPVSKDNSISCHRRTTVLNAREPPSAANRTRNRGNSDIVIEDSHSQALRSSQLRSRPLENRKGLASSKEDLVLGSPPVSNSNIANGQRRTTALQVREPPSSGYRDAINGNGSAVQFFNSVSEMGEVEPQVTAEQLAGRSIDATPLQVHSRSSDQQQSRMQPGDQQPAMRSPLSASGDERFSREVSLALPSMQVACKAHLHVRASENWQDPSVQKEISRNRPCTRWSEDFQDPSVKKEVSRNVPSTASVSSEIAGGSLDRAVGSTLGAVVGLQEHAGLLRSLIETQRAPTAEVVQETWKYARELERVNRQWGFIRGEKDELNTATTALYVREDVTAAHSKGGEALPLFNVISEVTEVEPQVMSLAARLWGWDVATTAPL